MGYKYYKYKRLNIYNEYIKTAFSPLRRVWVVQIWARCPPDERTRWPVAYPSHCEDDIWYEHQKIRILLSPSPDEECGGDQHHSQVHRHRRLEIEPLEECGGVADPNKEKRGEEGRQQLIS